MTVEVTPPDGAAQFAVWKQWVERQIVALGRARRLPNASLRGGALDILADNGDLRARLGVQADTRVAQTFYDPDGNELVRLGEQPNGTTGLNIAAGRLTIEGATVDAVTLAANSATINGASLDTTLSSKVSTTLTAPAWATRAFIIATIVFQMSNVSGATQRMRYRTDVNGSPGAGSWNHDVAASLAANQSAQQVWPLSSGVAGSTITVDALAAVDSGTNNTNVISIGALGVFFRA